MSAIRIVISVLKYFENNKLFWIIHRLVDVYRSIEIDNIAVVGLHDWITVLDQLGGGKRHDHLANFIGFLVNANYLHYRDNVLKKAG